jgi:UPF0755 protein
VRATAWMLGLVVVAGCLPDGDAPVDPSRPEPFVFEVPRGSSASGLGPTLASQGLVPSEFQWKLYLRSADASCLKAGKFEVSRAMSMNELVETLCGVPLADDVPFTILEGWRIRDVDAALAEKGWIEEGAYASVALGKTVESPFDVTSPTYEGYLWPETYMISPDGFDPGSFVQRQLRTFDEKFRSTHPDLGGRTLHEIVVMASMLEREEPKPKNRPLVAGILWKRIDHDTPLGVDATSRYELKEWNDRTAFLAKLRDPNDPYNSRLNRGLPPTAIGAPTLSSLEAAISPEKSEHWYYLHDAQGEIHPARNGAEHEANRKKYNVY